MTIAVLLAGSFVLASAGIQTDRGDRDILAVADSTSTFEIDEVAGIFPLDTVEVSVYLESDSTMGFIQNRIGWDEAKLVLLDAYMGPGVPDTAAFVFTSGADSINFTIYDSAEFQVASGQPIAYLKFEVQCFGYGAKAFIDYIGGDDINYYNHNNMPYSPLRDGGWVQTSFDGYWDSFCYPEYTVAYPGQQVIPMDVIFEQSVPGRLTGIWLTYDTTVVHCDSVVAGAGLGSGTMNVTTSFDTIKIDFPGTNPMMAVGEELTVLTLYFGAEGDGDDYMTNVGMPYVAKVTECGNVTSPFHNGNNIIVDNHWVDADLGEVSYYTSATTYDVPMTLDSNVPINDFEFWVHFPADEIAFQEVVSVAGFTTPSVTVDANDTTLLQINSGISTDYDPGDLPATVFKLRFQKLGTVAVGDTFHVTFYSTPQNEARYDMDAPFGYHTADLTLDGGFIRIKSKPVNTCPALYVWNGESYELDNTILAACDGADIRDDITEFYKIRKAAVPEDGKLLFRVTEEGYQFSTLRDFRIMAVDHEAGKPIHVAEDGTVMTVGRPFAIAWARDNRGRDIKALVESRDDVAYESSESGYIDVSFGAMSAEQVSNFVATSQELPKEIDGEDRDVLTASADELESRDKKLRVYVQGADGDWKFIGMEDARRNPGLQATSLASEYIEAGRELVIRYAWDEFYSIDVVDLRAAEEFEGRVLDVPVLEASHSSEGRITRLLGAGEAAEPATLSPGEAIELSFDVSAMPPMKAGTVREYVFVTTGHYTDVGAEGEETPGFEFALEGNYPNPFNPNTVIRYSLRNATEVRLAVYDVRGALVRTLVSGFQDAGKYRIDWDGTNDRGGRVSSGVYFYRIKTPEFTDTRKMVLLR